MIKNQIDLAFIQEPYVIHNSLAGIPKLLQAYATGNGRKRAAVLVNKKTWM